MTERKSGILLHPASLPGPGAMGTFGREARAFIDFLADAGQSLWQILPLHPCGDDGSPYNASSAFAIDPLFIDVEELVRDGLADTADIPEWTTERCDRDRAREHLDVVLERAYRKYDKNRAAYRADFLQFLNESAYWVFEYSLFSAVSTVYGTSEWSQWPEDLARCYDMTARREFSGERGRMIEKIMFEQWLCDRQWSRIRDYAEKRGVSIIGDMPFYVSPASCDTWEHQLLFKLRDGTLTACAGVPPDYFSETGQLWGNPLYDWDTMRAFGFRWWLERFASALRHFHMIRIDHFRGFSACWSVPAGEETAVNGSWTSVPGRELLGALRNDFGNLPVIAEDLGDISDDVRAMRDELGFPGMKVLQFAFDGDTENEFLPHNYRSPEYVVYTGTHDNDTTVGWYESLDEHRRNFVDSYLNLENGGTVHEKMIRLAMSSIARYVMIPMQDVLGTGSETRMNVPNTVGEDNWSWRMPSNLLTENRAKMLRRVTALFGRCSDGADRPGTV